MRGGDKFRQRLAELAAQATTVGIIEQANYEGSDGESVAQVAFWNEYGTARTPARPFFRNTIAERKTEWARLAGKFMQANGGDVRQSLAELGQAAFTAFGVAASSSLLLLVADESCTMPACVVLAFSPLPACIAHFPVLLPPFGLWVLASTKLMYSVSSVSLRSTAPLEYPPMVSQKAWSKR